MDPRHHRRLELIDAGDYARLCDRYAPLAEAVRDLMRTSLRTGAQAETIGEATAAIEAVTRTLRGDPSEDPSPIMQHRQSGRPVVWTNPVTGLRNPLAPPLIVDHDGEGRCSSRFSLGDLYEGPPGLVHGGVCALLLDQLLGEAATNGLIEPKFTGSISVRYRRGTPLGPLYAEASIERVEDHKTYARGFIADAEGPTVEAEGVFIMPAWARGGRDGPDR